GEHGELPAAGEEPLPSVHVEVPRDRAHGDFATNAALALASSFRRPPRDVAAAIVRHLDLPSVGVERAEIAGPGFINFRRPGGSLRDVIGHVGRMGTAYGQSRTDIPMNIIRESASATRMDPMNVVTARAEAEGD